MKSFRKLLVFAVIAVMLIVSTSCGKSDTAEEAEKESVQVEESENKEAEKEVAAEKEATEEVNVVASEESTVAETEGELSESDDEEVVELSLLNGTFYSTLIGLADYDLVDDPYINSVEIEDGYLVIQGSLKETADDDDADVVDVDADDVDDVDDDADDADDVDDDADDVDDDADDADDVDDDADDDTDMDEQDDMNDESAEDAGLHEADIYRFKITDETEFYSAGGSLGEISITLDEFIELAHYYNGLGMVLEIEDGILEEARITS